ncbi:hypothetical protein ACFIOY_22385 [Bradyrhizobium sp. TZ2]
MEQEVTMKSHRLPFENRWTNSAHAWEWNCELDRLGVPNVRAMFVDHEAHHPAGMPSYSIFRPGSSGIGLRSMIAGSRANSFFGAPP